MALHTQMLSELRDGMDAGDFSAVDIAEALLARIAEHDDTLNAMLTVTADEALDAARAADRRRGSSDAGALNGLPVIHKDIFCTRGVRTTCGSKMLENFVSPYDATVVDKNSRRWRRRSRQGQHG